jgi:hypothetical protein
MTAWTAGKALLSMTVWSYCRPDALKAGWAVVRMLGGMDGATVKAEQVPADVQFPRVSSAYASPTADSPGMQRQSPEADARVAANPGGILGSEGRFNCVLNRAFGALGAGSPLIAVGDRPGTRRLAGGKDDPPQAGRVCRRQGRRAGDGTRPSP